MTGTDFQTSIAQSASGNYDFAELVVKLFAAMTKVDGVVLDIENLVAKSLINAIEPCEATRLMAFYEQELSDGQRPDNIGEIAESIAVVASAQQRKDLVRMLSSIAISDGELHTRENDLIHGMITRLGTHGG